MRTRHVRTEARAPRGGSLRADMAGCAPLDASWERVETLQAPEGEGWELVEESDELVVLDLADAAHAAKMDVNLQPGTEVVMTVRAARSPRGSKPRRRSSKSTGSS